MIFIIEPRLGLCNQLDSIIKSILLCKKYNRDLYINKFQANLNDNNSLCDINEILDIDKMNDYLNENNIKIKLLHSIDNNISQNVELLDNVDYNTIPSFDKLSHIIECNSHKMYLNIGNPVMMNVFDSSCSDSADHYNLYLRLSSNIKFHEKFYTLKNIIKTQLKLENYISMHMRIEDDALIHFANCYGLSIEDYNNKLISFYVDSINKNKESRIYISSSMTYFCDSINLNFYNNLLKNNTNLCDKKNIIIDEYYLKNRELLAIIDLLIAYDGEKFFGCWISSYTQFINNYFKLNCKSSTVFKI
jgi:hypothetical protein